MAALHLNTPANGEEIVLEINETLTEFTIDFPIDAVIFEKVDDTLSIYFEEQDAVIVLDNFYAIYHEDFMPDFLIDGNLIAGADFFSAFDPELMPSMGYVQIYSQRNNLTDQTQDLADGTDSLDGILGESGYSAEGLLSDAEGSDSESNSDNDSNSKTPASNGGTSSLDTELESFDSGDVDESPSIQPEIPSRPTPSIPTTSPEVTTPPEAPKPAQPAPDFAPELNITTESHNTYDNKQDTNDTNADSDSNAQTTEGSFTFTPGDGDTTISITGPNDTSITITVNKDGSATISPNTIEGEYGSLSVTYESGTVHYTYEQDGNAYHESDDALKDIFDIKVSDSDSNSKDDLTGSIEINIHDDGPSISESSVNLAELNTENTSVSFDLDNVVNFGGDGEANTNSIVLTVPADSAYTLTDNVLYFEGKVVGSVEINQETNEITINTDSKDESFNNQELPTLDLNYTVTDSDGDTATGSLNTDIDFDYGNSSNDDSENKQDIKVEITTDNNADGNTPSTNGIINKDELNQDNGIKTTITFGPDAQEGDTITVTLTDSEGNEYQKEFEYEDLELKEDGSFEVTFETPENGFPEGGVKVDATITDADGNSAKADDSATLDTLIKVESTSVSSDDDALNTPHEVPLNLDDDVSLDFEGSFKVTQEDGSPLGEFTIGTDGKLTFTQTAPFVHGTDSNLGTVTSKVPVIDTNGNIGFLEVTVNVGDSAPTAETDSNTVAEGGTIKVDAENGLLSNDTQSADGTSTITSVQAGGWESQSNDGVITLTHPSHGTLIVNPDGSYSFTSKSDSVSADTSDFKFTYTVTDSDGDSSTADLVIKPTNAHKLTTEDYTNSVIVDEEGLANGSDSVADSESVTWTPPNGYTIDLDSIANNPNSPYEVSVDAQGNLVVTLTDNVSHEDVLDYSSADDIVTAPNSITITLKDANGNSSEVTIDVKISDDDISIYTKDDNMAAEDVEIYTEYTTQYEVTLKDGTTVLTTENPYSIKDRVSHTVDNYIPVESSKVTATAFKYDAQVDGGIAATSGTLGFEGADGVAHVSVDFIYVPNAGTGKFINIEGKPVGISSEVVDGITTYTAAMNGETYFTLTFNKTGKWDYIQIKSFEGEVSLKVTATDGDGDADTQYITIAGTNEIIDVDMSISDSNLHLDEANLADGTNPDNDALTQEGHLVIEGSAPKSITIGEVTFFKDGDTWKSEDGSESVKVDNGTVKITSVETNADGQHIINYEYTLEESIDSGDISSVVQDKTSFDVTISGENETSVTTTVNVHVNDDAPEDIQDIATTTNSDTATVIVDIDFGADNGAGKTLEFGDKTFECDADGNWSSSDGGNVTINEDGSVTLEGDGMSLNNSGSSNLWTATVENVPESGTLQQNVTVKDADGDTESFNITAERGETPEDAIAALNGSASYIEAGTDYNVSIILDTSASMWDNRWGGVIDKDPSSDTFGETRLDAACDSIIAFIQNDLLPHVESGHGGQVVLQITTFWGKEDPSPYSITLTEDNVDEVIAEIESIRDLKNEELLYNSDGSVKLTNGLPTYDNGVANQDYHHNTYYSHGFKDATEWLDSQSKNGFVNQVFLLTDGQPNDIPTIRNEAFADLENALGENGEIHAIGMGKGSNGNTLNAYDSSGNSLVLSDSNIHNAFTPEAGTSSFTVQNSSITVTSEGESILVGGSNITALKEALQEQLGGSVEVTDNMLIEYMQNNPEWAEANVISLQNDPDAMIAGEGNDLLYGQGGDDILIGDGDTSNLEKLAKIAGMDTKEYSSENIQATDINTSELVQDLVEQIQDTVENTLTADNLLSNDEDIAGRIDDFLEAFDDLDDDITGNDIIYGGEGDDLILGLSGDDALFGGLGDDIMIGGSGSDFLFGGDGNDILYGGEDEIFEDVKGDMLLGDGEELQGNVLDGGAGDDIIIGGVREDILLGGTGSDTLEGGAGEDTFTWRLEDFAHGDVDVAVDFNVDEDTLDLSELKAEGYIFEVVENTEINGFDILVSDGTEEGVASQTISLNDVGDTITADELNAALNSSGTFGFGA